MRIFCRTLVLMYRPWRNFWLPFRKRLITSNRLCPCIYLAPATRGKATFASIVFSASTAMPIQTFPMRNATSYPCRLHLSNTYRDKKKAFVCRLFNAFFVCFFSNQRVVQHHVQHIYPGRVQATSQIRRSYWPRFPAVQQIRLPRSERVLL
jgi:hypothetical protein